MDAATQELISRFREGDQVAFTELYHMLYHSVLFHTRGLLKQQQAEEATADAFYKLWLNRAQFDHVGSIKKWLQVTATNRSINMLKEDKAISKKHDALAYLTDTAWEQAYNRNTAEYDLFAKISAEIEKLAPQQKRVLKLYYFSKMTIAQIATELHISEITVKQTKARALELLKRNVSLEDLLAFSILLSGAFPQFYH